MGQGTGNQEGFPRVIMVRVRVREAGGRKGIPGMGAPGGLDLYATGNGELSGFFLAERSD